MRRPHLWWCLAAVGVQIAGVLMIRHLSLSAFGVGVGDAPAGVVGTAMTSTAIIGVLGMITAIGATWTLIRGVAWRWMVLGVLCVTTPALLLSGFTTLVWAVSLGW